VEDEPRSWLLVATGLVGAPAVWLGFNLWMDPSTLMGSKSLFLTALVAATVLASLILGGWPSRIIGFFAIPAFALGVWGALSIGGAETGNVAPVLAVMASGFMLLSIVAVLSVVDIVFGVLGIVHAAGRRMGPAARA
jgi:hypothetical protein